MGDFVHIWEVGLYIAALIIAMECQGRIEHIHHD